MMVRLAGRRVCLLRSGLIVAFDADKCDYDDDDDYKEREKNEPNWAEPSQAEMINK